MKRADIYRDVPIRYPYEFETVKTKMLKNGNFHFKPKLGIFHQAVTISSKDGIKVKLEMNISNRRGANGGYIYHITLSYIGKKMEHVFSMKHYEHMDRTPCELITNSYPDFHGRPDEYFLYRCFRILEEENF